MSSSLERIAELEGELERLRVEVKEQDGKTEHQQSSRPTSKHRTCRRALSHRRRPLILARAHRSCRATTTQLLSRPDATRTPVPSKGSGRQECVQRRRKKTRVRLRAHARQHSSPLPQPRPLGPAERPQPVLDCEPACGMKHPASAPGAGLQQAGGAADGVFARVRRSRGATLHPPRITETAGVSMLSVSAARSCPARVAIPGCRHRRTVRPWCSKTTASRCELRAQDSGGLLLALQASAAGAASRVASVATEVSPVQDRPEDSASSSRRRKPGSTPRSTRRLNSRPCRNSLTSSAAGGARSDRV